MNHNMERAKTMNKEPQTVKCDCRIEFDNNPVMQRSKIFYCPLHQAAPELVELSKKALIFIKIIGGAPGQLAESLEETINTAEGR